MKECTQGLFIIWITGWTIISCNYYSFDLEEKCWALHQAGYKLPKECNLVIWDKTPPAPEDDRCKYMECGEDRGLSCGTCDETEWCDLESYECRPLWIAVCDGERVWCETDEFAHCTSTNDLQCCTTARPVFCDEDEYGTAGCYEESIDCATRIDCGGTQVACYEGFSSHCSAGGTSHCCDENSIFCDDQNGVAGACFAAGNDCTSLTSCDGIRFVCDSNWPIPFCTSTGEMHCCAEGDVYCEDLNGVPGGCFVETSDCSTLFFCAGGSYVCTEENLQPYCSSNDVPFCCGQNETFCDAYPDERTVGCWNAPNLDCNGIIPCGDTFVACQYGSTPYCTIEAEWRCCGEDFPVFCDGRPDGYNGGCWDSRVECDTIINCDGSWMSCPGECGSDCIPEGPANSTVLK